MSNPVKQYEDALAKAEELKPLAVQYLKDRKAEIENELKQVEKEIAAMTGETPQKAPKPPKIQGKQISFRLLAELLKERPDRTLHLRKEGYDSKWMKKLAQDNPKKLVFGGSGPWPTVTLK